MYSELLSKLGLNLIDLGIIWIEICKKVLIMGLLMIIRKVKWKEKEMWIFMVYVFNFVVLVCDWCFCFLGLG